MRTPLMQLVELFNGLQLITILRERLLCRGCASLLAVSPSIVRGRASAGQYLTVFCISGVDTHTHTLIQDL